MSTCEHGNTLGGTQLSGPFWGGVGTCRCCSQTFGVLHSTAFNSSDGVIWSTVQDETLCPSCGGTRREFLHEDYEVVREHGALVIRRKEKP